MNQQAKPDFHMMLNDLAEIIPKHQIFKTIGIAHNTFEGYLYDIKPIPAEYTQGYAIIVLWLQHFTHPIPTTISTSTTGDNSTDTNTNTSA